jgi:hypothetical protein
MIPSKAHPKWRSLVKGEIKPNFRVFSGNLLLHRLESMIRLDSSEKNINKCIDEAIEFFTKFEALFQDELAQIFK